MLVSFDLVLSSKLVSHGCVLTPPQKLRLRRNKFHKESLSFVPEGKDAAIYLAGVFVEAKAFQRCVLEDSPVEIETEDEKKEIADHTLHQLEKARLARTIRGEVAAGSTNKQHETTRGGRASHRLLLRCAVSLEEWNGRGSRADSAHQPPRWSKPTADKLGRQLPGS